MAERFHIHDAPGPGEYILTGAEAHHLATVRRCQPGDLVTFFNGDGNEYVARVVEVGKKQVMLTVLSIQPVDRELPFALVVASALPKGDRADFLIEKLTELGVTRFVPLITARAVVVPRPSVVEKLSRIVIEASKQCGRNRLMVIDPPTRWADFPARQDLPRNRFILHTAPDTTPLSPPRNDGAAFAMGPEGGFSPDEVKVAVEAGWRVAGLGPRTLRVETAAVAAAALAAANQRRGVQ
jgi:16S rRNA (uracil1498-N3)-methyltransferase